MWRIGVDLGGTKIEAVALGPDGQEAGRRRVSTPRNDYAGTLDAVTSLIAASMDGIALAEVAGVGLGIPGSISSGTGLVRNANSVWLNGTAFHADLQARLPFPLFVDNDANCFALSESIDGAGAGYGTVFGVILGTGVGGGLIMRGSVIRGRNAIGGEWGHNPLPWPEESERPGALCYCGRRGCIETFLSGPALEQQYYDRVGRSAGAKMIAERASKGDPESRAVLSLYAARLAKALASVVNVLDPDVIIFGGGVSNIGIIIRQAHAELPKWIFSDGCETGFLPNRWGDSSGVRGAAMLVHL